MTFINIGGGHTIVLEKVVAFRLSDPDRAERFLMVFLEGGHKLRTGDDEGIARFLGATELESARRGQET